MPKNVLCLAGQTRPFKIEFKADEDEVTSGAGTDMPRQSELSDFPAGIIGFHLNYLLQDCA